MKLTTLVSSYDTLVFGLIPFAEYNERYLARTYSAFYCIASEPTQPQPATSTLWLDIPIGLSASLAPKAANNVSYAYSGVLKGKFWIA